MVTYTELLNRPVTEPTSPAKKKYTYSELLSNPIPSKVDQSSEDLGIFGQAAKDTTDYWGPYLKDRGGVTGQAIKDYIKTPAPERSLTQKITDPLLGIAEAPTGVVQGLMAFGAGAISSAPDALGLTPRTQGADFWSRLSGAKKELDRSIESYMIHPTTPLGQLPLDAIGGFFELGHEVVADAVRGVGKMKEEPWTPEREQTIIEGAQYLFDIATLGLGFLRHKGKGAAKGEKAIPPPKEAAEQGRAAIKEQVPDAPPEVIDVAIQALERVVKEQRAKEGGPAKFAGNQYVVDALRLDAENRTGGKKAQYNRVAKFVEELTTDVKTVDLSTGPGMKNPKSKTRMAVERYVKEREAGKAAREASKAAEQVRPVKPVKHPIVDEHIKSDAVVAAEHGLASEKLGEFVPEAPAKAAEPVVTSMKALEVPAEPLMPIARFDTTSLAKGEGYEIPKRQRFKDEASAIEAAAKEGEGFEAIQIGDKYAVARWLDPASEIPKFRTLEEIKQTHDVGSEITKRQALKDLELLAEEGPEFGVAQIGDKYYRTTLKPAEPMRKAGPLKLSEIPSKIEALGEKVREEMGLKESKEPSKAELLAEEMALREELKGILKEEKERPLPTGEVRPEVTAAFERYRERLVAKINKAIIEPRVEPPPARAKFDPTNIEHLRPFIERYKVIKGVTQDTRMIKALQKGDPKIFETKAGKQALEDLGYTLDIPERPPQHRPKSLEKVEELGLLDDTFKSFKTREEAIAYRDSMKMEGEILGPDPKTGKYYLEPRLEKLEDLTWEAEVLDQRQFGTRRERMREDVDASYELSDTGMRNLWDVFGNERGIISLEPLNKILERIKGIASKDTIFPNRLTREMLEWSSQDIRRSKNIGPVKGLDNIKTWEGEYVVVADNFIHIPGTKSIGESLSNVSHPDFRNLGVTFNNLRAKDKLELTNKVKEEYINGLIDRQEFNRANDFIEGRSILGNQRGAVRGLGPIGLVAEMGVEGARIFYSKTMRLLDEIKSDAPIKAEEIWSYLSNRGMGKHEEGAARLTAFFNLRRNEKLRPSEVKDYVRANLIEVKEHILGEPSKAEIRYNEAMKAEIERAKSYLYKHDHAEYLKLLDTPERWAALELSPDFISAAQGRGYKMSKEFTDVEIPRESFDTKYKDYAREPGGIPGTYREAFLTAENLKESWIDGHSGYGHIKNPIVRIIYDKVELLVDSKQYITFIDGLETKYGKNYSLGDLTSAERSRWVDLDGDAGWAKEPVIRINEMQTPVLRLEYSIADRRFHSKADAEAYIQKHNAKGHLDIIPTSKSIGRTVAKDFSIVHSEALQSKVAYIHFQMFMDANKQSFVKAMDTYYRETGSWNVLGEGGISYNNIVNRLRVRDTKGKVEVMERMLRYIDIDTPWTTRIKAGDKLTAEHVSKINNAVTPFNVFQNVPVVNDIRYNAKDIQFKKRGPFTKMPDYLQKNAYDMGVKWIIAKAKEEGINHIVLTKSDRILAKYTKELGEEGIKRLYDIDLPKKFERYGEKSEGEAPVADAMLDTATYNSFPIKEQTPSAFSVFGNQRGAVELPFDIQSLRNLRTKVERLATEAEKMGQSLEVYLRDTLGLEGVTLKNTIDLARSRGEIDRKLRQADPIIEGIFYPESPIVSQKVETTRSGAVIKEVPLTLEMVTMLKKAPTDIAWKPSMRRTPEGMREGLKSLPKTREWVAAYMQWTELPLAAFERYGFQKIWWKWVKQERARREWIRSEHSAAAKLEKTFSKQERQDMAVWSYAQMKGGPELLASMGINEIPVMTPRQMKGIEWFHPRHDMILDRANYVRTHVGQNPIGKVDNYFTWQRQINKMIEMGLYDGMLHTPPGRLAQIAKEFKLDFNPYAQKRVKKSEIPVELDIFSGYRKYVETMSREMYTAPVAALAKKLAHAKLSKKTGEKGKASFERTNPEGSWVLDVWADNLMGVNVLTEFNKKIKGFRILTTAVHRNLVAAILLGKVNTVLKQPSAFTGTIGLVGLPYMLYGTARAAVARPFAWARGEKTRAREISDILTIRRSDYYFDQYHEIYLRGGMSATRHKAGEIAGLPMNLFDSFTAEASWNAFYDHARQIQKMNPQAAKRWADRGVTYTQSVGVRGAIAPIQGVPGFNLFVIFQSFAITDFNHIARNLIGIKNPDVRYNPAHFKRVARYIAAATAINMLFHQMGTDPPHPAPFKEGGEWLEEGGNPTTAGIKGAISMFEKFPIIGGPVKYGGSLLGPGGELASNLPAMINDIVELTDWERLTPGQKLSRGLFMGETLGWMFGIPMTRQIRQSIRAATEDAEWWQIILGVYDYEAKKKGGWHTPLKDPMNDMLKGPLQQISQMMGPSEAHASVPRPIDLMENFMNQKELQRALSVEPLLGHVMLEENSVQRGWDTKTERWYPGNFPGDRAEVQTIAYGHVVQPGEDFSKGISQQQAIELAVRDIATARRQVRERVKVKLDAQQTAALAMLFMNTGPGANPKAIAALNKGDMNTFLEEAWGSGAIVTGRDREGNRVVLPGLVKRRELERAIWEGEVELADASPRLPRGLV